MVLDHTVQLLNQTVVMLVIFVAYVDSHCHFRVWISSQDAAAVAAKGFHVVHAPTDYFYLVSCPQDHFSTDLNRVGLWWRNMVG